MKHATRQSYEDYLKRRQRLIDAGLLIGHSRLRGQVMYLSAQDDWEPFDLEKAEKHFQIEQPSEVA